MPAQGKTQVADHMARELETKIDGPVFYSPSQVLGLIPRDHYIYIFSLYPEKIVIERGSLGRITIQACPPGAPYNEPIRFGAVVSTTYFDAMTQTMKTDDTRAEFVAQDIVHPYLAGDWSVGQNREDKGVFWTKNEKPTQAELNAARVKMEKFLRKQLQYANQLENQNKLQFITPDMVIAANYFHEDRAWNRTYQRHEACPGCGGEVKPGIIRHNCGFIYDWPRAVLFGMATLEQASGTGIDVPKLKAEVNKLRSRRAKPAPQAPDVEEPDEETPKSE